MKRLKMGRKTKYRDDFPALVEGLARRGLTEDLIAKKIGVSHNAFNNFKNKYSEFVDALKRGKAPVAGVHAPRGRGVGQNRRPAAFFRSAQKRL